MSCPIALLHLNFKAIYGLLLMQWLLQQVILVLGEGARRQNPYQCKIFNLGGE